MRKIIMAVPARNIMCIFFCMIAFFILLPILLVGIGSNGKSNGNSDKKAITNESQYIIDSNSIVLKKTGEIPKIKVFLTSENRIEEMNIEDYVRGVVSGEMPITFETEALKAQAIAARTYAVSKMASLGGKACDLHKDMGVDICDTVHCQVYKSKESRFKDWDSRNADAYWQKLTDIVSFTAGQVLTYDGNIVTQPLYFSSSGSGTEDAAQVFSSNVPYLRSVDSPGDNMAPNYVTTVDITLKALADKINNAYPKAKVSSSKLKGQISIISRNAGGTVNDLKIGDEVIKGRKFRELLGLNSANFSLKFSSSAVQITCKGYGHDVGMSQWGANAMAKNGSNYLQILTHYYSGVEVKKLDDVYK